MPRAALSHGISLLVQSLSEPRQGSMQCPQSGAAIDLAGRSHIADANSGAGRSSFLGAQMCTLWISEENRSWLWNVGVSSPVPGSIEFKTSISGAFNLSARMPTAWPSRVHSMAVLLRTSPLEMLQSRAHTHGTKDITLLRRFLPLDTTLLGVGHTSNIGLGIVRCGAPDADPLMQTMSTAELRSRVPFRTIIMRRSPIQRLLRSVRLSQKHLAALLPDRGSNKPRHDHCIAMQPKHGLVLAQQNVQGPPHGEYPTWQSFRTFSDDPQSSLWWFTSVSPVGKTNWAAYTPHKPCRVLLGRPASISTL